MLIAITATLLTLDAWYARVVGEGLFLVPLLLFFTLGTAWDLSQLLGRRGVTHGHAASVIGAGVIAMSAIVPVLFPPAQAYLTSLGWVVVSTVTVTFGLLCAQMVAYRPPDDAGTAVAPLTGSLADSATVRLMAGVLVAVYVGVPLSLMVATRALGEGNWGLAALLTIIATTKSADAGAYFAGKSLGRNKLIPRLSPGKTWEGLAGGAVTATIVAAVCLSVLFPWIAGFGHDPSEPLATPGVGLALILGPSLTLAGVIGDLAESLVKRDCGAKDSGTWLPGLGGVWDVTDSLIAGILPGFLCFSAAT